MFVIMIVVITAFGAAPSTGLFGQTAAATAPSGKTYAGASSLFSVGASSRSFADKAQGGTTVKFKVSINSKQLLA